MLRNINYCTTRRPVLVEQTQKIYFISFLLGDLHYFQPREYLVSPNAANGCWSVQGSIHNVGRRMLPVPCQPPSALFLGGSEFEQCSFHYIVLIVKSGGCCYNFGKLISSCTRCHNIQLKYYFPALPWPCCGHQPASEKALGWKAKLSAAHSVNGAVHTVVHRSRG